MYEVILNHIPSTWVQPSEDEKVPVIEFCHEYMEIKRVLENAIGKTVYDLELTRYQKVNRYGQYLLREQFLVLEDPTIKYYKVRRFFKIHKQHLTNALEYNLDPRRINSGQFLSLDAHIETETFDPDTHLILIVQVVTKTPNQETICPSRDTEYYIEYISKIYL